MSLKLICAALECLQKNQREVSRRLSTVRASYMMQSVRWIWHGGRRCLPIIVYFCCVRKYALNALQPRVGFHLRCCVAVIPALVTKFCQLFGYVEWDRDSTRFDLLSQLVRLSQQQRIVCVFSRKEKKKKIANKLQVIIFDTHFLMPVDCATIHYLNWCRNNVLMSRVTCATNCRAI